jgi:hypothetical protein
MTNKHAWAFAQQVHSLILYLIVSGRRDTVEYLMANGR